MAGALGAALGGRFATFSGIRVALLTGAAAAALAVAGLVAAAVGGLLALAAFYLLHHLVLVVLDARLQARIEGRARATTTSVAGLGTEIVGLGLFGVWAARPPGARDRAVVRRGGHPARDAPTSAPFGHDRNGKEVR